MDTQTKTMWLEALRSGKYQQGEGRLCTVETVYDAADRLVLDTPRFCCLGVLANELGFLETDFADPFLEVRARFEDATNAAMLPSTLDSFLGLQDYAPRALIQLAWPDDDADELAHDGVSISGVLANLNDQGKSFAEIADIIEANL